MMGSGRDPWVLSPVGGCLSVQSEKGSSLMPPGMILQQETSYSASHLRPLISVL